MFLAIASYNTLTFNYEEKCHHQFFLIAMGGKLRYYLGIEGLDGTWELNPPNNN
jgi:hypothetical protein